MAIKTVQIVQDDIDGSDGAATMPFSFDGSHYEIDLNEQHAEQFRNALMPWVEKARRVRGGRGGARRAAASSASPLRGRTTTLTEKGLTAKEVREWASMNGIEMNERGRIPDSVIEQYETAQRTPAPAPTKKAPAKKAAAKRSPRKAVAAAAES
jgi:hypothetical protein